MTSTVCSTLFLFRATYFLLYLRTFPQCGKLAPLVPRCPFQEQSCLYQFVLVVSLKCANCSLVADDQLHMIAYLRCDFLLHGLVSTHSNCSSREVLLQ